jgi:hypothetical protein
MGANRPGAFLWAFAAPLCLALVTASALNLIVEPLWRFDLYTVHGINQQRTQVTNYARLAKAGIVCRQRPAGLGRLGDVARSRSGPIRAMRA